ncbi:MAG: hypothetical protein ABIJ56_22540 [Pseudomonadota bacterium]
MPYLPYAERVIEYYSHDNSKLNPPEALARFQKLSGQYKDTDASYEERSRLFFDYLTFDFASGPYRSILHRYFVECVDKIRRENLADIMRGFLASHPSVFDITRMKSDTVTLKDLIGNGIFKLPLPEGAYGFVEGGVINARLISFKGSLVLGHGLLLHPELASPLINKLIQDLRKENILSWKSFHLLARMKMQYDMSPSFKLSSIYSPRSFLIKR